MPASAADAASLIDAVASWAAARDDVLGVALVGSHARGAARADSDVDFTIVCVDRARYMTDPGWVARFGEVVSVALEDRGKVQSLRVRYRDRPELELGFADLDWTAVPPEAGTARVLRDGCVILLDRAGLLARLLGSVRDDG